jgi:secreted trypsin-like serine protease
MIHSALLSMISLSTALASDFPTFDENAGAVQYEVPQDDFEPMDPNVDWIGLEGPDQIVGGVDVPAGAITDTVGLVDRWGQVFCTGTLIHRNLVITAGHCASAVRKVLIGSNDLSSSSGELVAAKTVWEYPNSQSTYDVAVIRLKRNSVYPPRAVAQGCVINNWMRDGAEVAIAGWGAIDRWGQTYINELQIGYTYVMDADCSTRGEGCNSAARPNGEFISGGNGVDTCFGDSGGPIYLLTPQGDYLVGVTSRGTFSSGGTCGVSSINVRADAMVNWIRTTTGTTLAGVSCQNPAPPEANPVLDPASPADFGAPLSETAETAEDIVAEDISAETQTGGCNTAGSSSFGLLAGLGLLAAARKRKGA